jgi:hypothetical protein
MTGVVFGTHVGDVPKWIEQKAADVAAGFQEDSDLWVMVTDACEDFVNAWIGRALALIADYGLAFDAVAGECNYEDSALSKFKNEVYERAKEILADEYEIYLD